MRCVILAAGYATHLYPLTKNFPKPLLEVGGKPVLDWLVEDIAAEADEFVVVSNHKFVGFFEKWAAGKQEALERATGESAAGKQQALEWAAGKQLAGKDLKIRVLDDGTESNETRLGAVKDIEFAVEQDGIDEDCLVMAGDNLLDFSLKEFIEFAVQTGASCVMCYKEENPEVLQRSAVIEMQEDGLITSMEEKPMEPKGTFVSPAFYYYKAADLKRIPEALADGCGYDPPGSFAAWLSRHVPIYAYKMPGMRHDIGNLESYEMTKKTYRGIQ